MIRKKVLSLGRSSATLLVQDTEANGALCVLRRVNLAGWSDGEVSAAVGMYEGLQRRRLRGFVPIHTVLLQGSFLSVVASYVLEGDVTTLIEEESESSFEEASVLRWLCACALAIRQMHLHGMFFPGLTTDRLLLDHQTGGTANILLGVPLPLPIYFSQLRERKENGVRVELDYPPEVLAAAAASPIHNTDAASNGTTDGVGYHPKLSDVWCLGRLGVVLLTAKGAALARRSGGMRQLLSRMMADEPAMRPSMESVVESLLALAGNVSLGQPPWPPRPVTDSAGSGGYGASVRSTPAASGRGSQAAALGGVGGSSITSSKLTVVGSRSAADDALKDQHAPASGASPSRPVASPRRGIVSGRAHDSRHPSAVAPVAKGHVSSPPRIKEFSSHLDPTVRPVHTPGDSWYRRTGEKIEMLQHMNASPSRQNALNGTGEAQQRSLRGDNGHQRLRGATSGPHTKALSPRRKGRGTPQDNNTRVLDEMLAEQREIRRRAEAWSPSQQSFEEDGKQLQREALRHLKLETAARQQEMRKHFTEWQRQNNQRLADSSNAEVIDQDGIVIVAPRPGPPPVSPRIPTAGSGAESTDVVAETQRTRREPQSSEHIKCTLTRHETPTSVSSPLPNSASRLATPFAKAPARGGSSSTPAVGETSARYSGNTPRTLYSAASTQAGNDASGSGPSVLPLRSAASPYSLPAPELSTVKPHPLRSSDLSRLPLSTSHDDKVTEEQPARVAGGGDGTVLKCSTDVSTLSAVEWSIDGIRSALRKLLRSRDLYGEIMQEVALFISQSEEDRLAVHSNEVFMRRLHKLLNSEALFLGAAPLCAQLVALEGLLHTLRGTFGSRPSR